MLKYKNHPSILIVKTFLDDFQVFTSPKWMKILFLKKPERLTKAVQDTDVLVIILKRNADYSAENFQNFLLTTNICKLI